MVLIENNKVTELLSNVVFRKGQDEKLSPGESRDKHPLVL
jgi:hypothetical protein